MAATNIEIADKATRRKAWGTAFFLMLAMVLCSVVLDQVSKLQAEKNLMVRSHDTDITSYEGQRYHIWETGNQEEDSLFFLSLGFNYVRNRGAAWGALSDLPDSTRKPFFFIVTLVAIIVIVLQFRSVPADHWLTRWSLMLILSGAIGNFLNRLTHGFVIDWIDVRWNLLGWQYNFPNFNWADCSITIGVALLLYDMWLHGPSAKDGREGSAQHSE